MAVAHDLWRRSILNSTARVLSPSHLLLVVMISVFVAETIVMFFLVLLPPLSVPVEAFLDAMLLTVMILPALYACVFRALVSHIIKRQQAEAACRESEEQYRQLTDNIREVFWLSSADLRQIVYVSPEYEKVWGRTCESLVTEPTSFLDSIHPEDRDRVITALPTQFQGKFAEEYRIVQPDGTVRWIRTRAFPVRNEIRKVYRIAGLAEDITDRKQAEQKLLAYQEQLQSLISELSLTEERERRRLATDLHDSIGQVLALSKLKLEALRGAASANGHARGLDDIGTLINQAIQQTRSLTFELSPSVLYQLGLEAAVESLAEHIQERHGIRIAFTDDDQCKPLTEDMQLLLFRAVQELLINVVKHAHAQQVQIAIGRDGEYIQITVTDDGVGFALSPSGPDAGREHGFGLFSISERLQHVHGYCTIDSQPGRGTQVTLMALLHREKNTVQECVA